MKNPQTTLLIRNGTVITLGNNPRVLPNHSVLIEQGIISAIMPDSECTAHADIEISAAGKLVMPGYINAHMHFYSTFARGMYWLEAVPDFPGKLRTLWWKLDKALTLEDCRYSAYIALIEAIRHGTTTFIDHHASPLAVRGSLSAIAQAVTDCRLRACLCYEVSDRDGEQVAQEGIDENINFLQECNRSEANLLRALFGLHASFTLTDATLQRAASAGIQVGAGFHIHAAEAVADQTITQNKYGKRVIERLHDFSILGEQSIAAHCVHVNDKEIELLAETGTYVAHNPQSNLNNAVGIMDMLKLSQAGVQVVLGTDAMTVKMPEELRVALWCQHLRNDDASAAFIETVNTLFVNNAKLASNLWNQKIGELTEGAAADIILVDYDPPTPFNNETLFGHLVFGIANAAVDTTIVNGNILMRNKQLTLDLDLEGIVAKSRELSQILWQKMQ
ncbi:MAG: putative aminohydrolase SsnA [bacterium]|nr:putative aminohydrolase SsnA [bacterium]